MNTGKEIQDVWLTATSLAPFAESISKAVMKFKSIKKPHTILMNIMEVLNAYRAIKSLVCRLNYKSIWRLHMINHGLVLYYSQMPAQLESM